MEEVREKLKEYVLKIMKKSSEAHPQEIATLPELIKSLYEITQKEEH